MKQKQIKIYSFGRSNIKDGIITSENFEDNTITLTESFLTLAFGCYKNTKIEDGQLIEEIIKVMLPDTEEEAKDEWDNGLIKEDARAYRKILKPFEKNSDKDEWLINIDTIRLFFKNIITSDNEDSDEFQEEAFAIFSNVVTKCEEIPNVSEEFTNLKFVKNNLARLIEMKCRELAYFS